MRKYSFLPLVLILAYLHLVGCTTFKPYVSNSSQVSTTRFEKSKRYQIVFVDGHKKTSYGEDIQINGDSLELSDAFSKTPYPERYPLADITEVKKAQFSAGKTLGLVGGIVVGIVIILGLLIIQGLGEANKAD